MYLKPTRCYYDSGGTQRAGRGLFLILVECKEKPGIRAIVRQVALRQFGPWMMGSARAYGHRISISGSYGADGLLREVPEHVFDRAVPLPAYLVDAWNKGGGHNSAGSEAPAMRKWALQHLDELRGKKARAIV